jgi:hypothetical protein
MNCTVICDATGDIRTYRADGTPEPPITSDRDTDYASNTLAFIIEEIEALTTWIQTNIDTIPYGEIKKLRSAYNTLTHARSDLGLQIP